MANKQILWIDVAKCMAIIAVMVDHTNGLLYHSSNIAYASYYSVTLFILISGMMCFLSNLRHGFSWWEGVKHSTAKIFSAYLFAVLVYHISAFHSFDLFIYLQNVVHFNISGPLYYVALYLQLMVLNRPLYVLLKKCKSYKYEIMVGICLLCISSFCTLSSNMMDIYGGGGKLFGGTYLFVFYTGMLLAKHNVFDKLARFNYKYLFMASSVLWCLWWQWICIDKLNMDRQIFLGGGQGFNPPNISFYVFALCTLLLCYSLVQFIKNIGVMERLIGAMSYIGKHTLFIFMFHLFCLQKAQQWSFLKDDIWLMRIGYFFVMIAGSIFIEYIYNKIKNLISDID